MLSSLHTARRLYQRAHHSACLLKCVSIGFLIIGGIIFQIFIFYLVFSAAVQYKITCGRNRVPAAAWLWLDDAFVSALRKIVAKAAAVQAPHDLCTRLVSWRQALYSSLLNFPLFSTPHPLTYWYQQRHFISHYSTVSTASREVWKEPYSPPLTYLADRKPSLSKALSRYVAPRPTPTSTAITTPAQGTTTRYSTIPYNVTHYHAS